MPAQSILASSQVEEVRDAQVGGLRERFPLMFDPWLTCSNRLVEVIGDNILSSYEHDATRQRRMKDRDRENWATMLRTLLANVALAHATNVDAMGVSLRTAKQKQTRYDRKGFGRLPLMLKTLSGRGMFSLHKSSIRGVASKIVIPPTFLGIHPAPRFNPKDFAHIKGQETIYLSRTERDYVDGTVSRELIDYPDTSETQHYRAELVRINEFLAKADLGMESDAGPLVITGIHHLRRYFNLPPGMDQPRFDLGGRLFGGWWQGVPRERRHAIRIDGEPIADLDFASMYLRLAYLKAGVAAPDGDLYAMIPGFADPRWRDGVKKTISAMLFRESPLTKVPRDLRDELPPGITGRRIRSAILTAHPALASVFETGIGLSLMFTESQILVAALLHLTERRVAALPMHDGLMVARSKATAAIDAMRTAAEHVVGVPLPITLK